MVTTVMLIFFYFFSVLTPRTCKNLSPTVLWGPGLAWINLPQKAS